MTIRLATHFSPDPEALSALVRSGQVRRLQVAPPSIAPSITPQQPQGPLPFSCGVAALDRALGGGFTRGAIHEVIAPPSSGGTALLRKSLMLATARGEVCGLIDCDHAFDPRGALETGVDLTRILWVVPQTLGQALRAAELLIEARLGLVVLDLGQKSEHKPPVRQRVGERREGAAVELVRFTAPQKGSRMTDSGWARLLRACEKHKGTLLVLSRVSRAGSFAASTLELSRVAAQWSGPEQARLLVGSSCTGAVTRVRKRSPSGPVRISLPIEEPPPWSDDRPESPEFQTQPSSGSVPLH